MAFTFPSVARPIIRKVSNALSKKYGKQRILYDEYYVAEFSRQNLDIYLQDLYLNESELIVVALCDDYANRKWCKLEWRAVRALLTKCNEDQVMFLKIDDGNVDGFFAEIDGYIDISGRTYKELAELIDSRYQMLEAKKKSATFSDLAQTIQALVVRDSRLFSDKYSNSVIIWPLEWKNDENDLAA